MARLFEIAIEYTTLKCIYEPIADLVSVHTHANMLRNQAMKMLKNPLLITGTKDWSGRKFVKGVGFVVYEDTIPLIEEALTKLEAWIHETQMDFANDVAWAAKEELGIEVDPVGVSRYLDDDAVRYLDAVHDIRAGLATKRERTGVTKWLTDLAYRVGW